MTAPSQAGVQQEGRMRPSASTMHTLWCSRRSGISHMLLQGNDSHAWGDGTAWLW
jgi:hypothetical protein